MPPRRSGDSGDAVEHVRHDLRSRVEAPVAGALHGIVELGVVEGSQLDLGRQVQQPDLHDAVHLGMEPRLSPARRGLQPGPDRHGRGDQDERRQRGADPVGRRALLEQRLQHAVGGQQREAGEDSGDQVQPDRRDRIAAVRLPAQPDGLADEPGQLPGDREKAGLGQPLVVGTPVRGSQFRRQFVGLGAGFGPGCLVRVVPQ